MTSTLIIINPTIDCSSNPGNSRNWHSTETIKQYMNDYGLSDSWRMRNPSLREYSYCSSSRIDLFLVSNSLAQHISANTIHPIIISDHAPVSLSINTHAHIKPPTRWRFNTSLLEDPDFSTLIKTEWASFITAMGNRQSRNKRQNHIIFIIQRKKKRTTPGKYPRTKN